MPKVFYSLVLFLLGTVASHAQIVNIENKRIHSDTTGWFGKLGTGFMFQQNVNRVLNINASAHAEYKQPKNLYLILVNYDLLRGNGKSFTNNVFSHLRYNRNISKSLRWEVFAQLQKNNVTGIQHRFLAGTGPRWKVKASPVLTLYFATAAMYEHEREQTDPPVIHDDIRSSSYITGSLKPIEALEISGTLFYQPLFKNFSDYRLLNELKFTYQIFRHLSLTTTWYYLFDSAPAADSPKLNYSISNGLEWEF